MLQNGNVALLDVVDVSVRFGGVQALDRVSLPVDPGHVTGLIGPNGAGKTTLFNVICGLQAPEAGAVLLDGEDITDARPHRRARLGVGRTFQRLETFGMLSARDNVVVAAQARRSWGSGRFDVDTVVDDIVERVGLRSVADVRVDRLPTGTARLVEVARALAVEPRVLLVDEPSAGLSEQETLTLGELLKDVASRGMAVLLVEHDMSFVMGTCDRIHVLDFGHVIAVGTPAEVQGDPVVRAAYLGSEDEPVEADAAAVTADEEPIALSTVLDREGVEHGVCRAAGPQHCRVGAARGARRLRRDRGTARCRSHRDARPGLCAARTERRRQVHNIEGVERPDSAYVGRALDRWQARGRHRTGRPRSPRPVPHPRRPGHLPEPDGRGKPAHRHLCRCLPSHRPRPRVRPLPAARRAQEAGRGHAVRGRTADAGHGPCPGHGARILLLDELSMGLAPLVVDELYVVVRRIAQEDVAILVVEQFAHEVLGVASVAGIIFHGRVEFTGSPEDVGHTLQSAYLAGVIEA